MAWNHRDAALAACLSALGAATLSAGDAPAPQPKPATSVESVLSEEDKWKFEPPPPGMRPDVFHDLEAVLKAENEAKKGEEKEEDELGPLRPESASNNDREKAVAFAKSEERRIEALLAARKYEDVIKTSEVTLKQLDRFKAIPEVDRSIAVIVNYRLQADEAQTREKAQAAFDALALHVEGIMWSESAGKLVIIRGEPRALGLNDRVKDCVIINIDTDRVDFRFHFDRKRFEFPRYVGEDVKVATQP